MNKLNFKIKSVKATQKFSLSTKDLKKYSDHYIAIGNPNGIQN